MKEARGEQSDLIAAELISAELSESHRLFDAVASAQIVNRTHRVVRKRAAAIVARKKTMRSLYIPLCVSAGLLASIIFAVWTLLDQYEAIPTGLPDASQQLLVLLMWCLPLTGAFLTVVWFRRGSEKPGMRGAR